MGVSCCHHPRSSADTGGTVDGEKLAQNHEAFLLMANSQHEMEDWVKAIRRVIWAPFGGGIFGQRLEDTVRYERKFGLRLAPMLVEQCVDFICEHGLTEEGLFRMPGQTNLVKDLQDTFDRGEKPVFDSSTDVHTVASLLKLYLRELPEPVIPFAKYEDFLSCAQLLSKDQEEGTQDLGRQVNNLPQANYNLLKYICRFLDEVQSHSSMNKMSVQNLATVFGPNILRPAMEDLVTIMEGTSLVQRLMTVLIREHRRLFAATRADVTGLIPYTISGVPATSTNGVPERDGESCRTEDLVCEQTITACVDLNVESATTRATIKPPVQSATSPNKRMQALPGWKCTFKPSSGRSPSPKFGSSNLDSPTLSPSGNWLINGLYSLRGHRRTSSVERAKDESTSQRFSTYDNVPLSSLSLSANSMGCSTWSSSSCELSIPDSISSCPACRGSDSSAFVGTKADWPGLSSLSQSEMKSTDSSMERLQVHFSSESSSEQIHSMSASKNPARCSRVLQGLVTELKTELEKQRSEYESRIESLEKTSAELRAKVIHLEEDVDHGRRRYALLEIKLRNSERAREDAEGRNLLLQREMERFFSTLGNLSLGSKEEDV